jgi:glycerol-3-phosphate dehydrogenase (NAD(P)+)
VGRNGARDMNIAIVGAGAWGTALAIALSGRHRVTLCARDPLQANAMLTERRNRRYLAEVPLPAAVAVADDAASVLAQAELALIATPTGAMRDALAGINACARPLPVVWACKGFEPSTGALPHRIIAEALAHRAPCGALSGPSFALEVAQGRPTALTLASTDLEFARATARALHQATLRVYFSNDLIGVELGGAVKNVLAIATGICDGLELGLNARAAVITRGLAEMTRLGVASGGRAETFMGLTGAGDLILTCTGELSRNRRVGLLLGRGEPLAKALGSIGHVAEGVQSAREVERAAAERGVDMPITRAVCGVLFGGVNPEEAVQQLLGRDPKSET